MQLPSTQELIDIGLHAMQILDEHGTSHSYFFVDDYSIRIVLTMLGVSVDVAIYPAAFLKRMVGTSLMALAMYVDEDFKAIDPDKATYVMFSSIRL